MTSLCVGFLTQNVSKICCAVLTSRSHPQPRQPRPERRFCEKKAQGSLQVQIVPMQHVCGNRSSGKVLYSEAAWRDSCHSGIGTEGGGHGERLQQHARLDGTTHTGKCPAHLVSDSYRGHYLLELELDTWNWTPGQA